MKLGDLGDVEAARKRAEDRAEALEKRVNTSNDCAVKSMLIPPSQMEDTLRVQLTQKESELNATYDERIHNYEEREKDLQRQVSLVKTQLRELQSSNESKEAKLLNHTQRQDGAALSTRVEMDMLLADLERANSRVAAVERRNELLRAEIEGVRTGSGSDER